MESQYEYCKVKTTDTIRSAITSLLQPSNLSDKLRQLFQPHISKDGENPEVISFKDVVLLQKELSDHASGSSKEVFLCDLLKGADVCLPSVEPMKRSPALEARLARLKMECDAKEYSRMTMNVSARGKGVFHPEESIGSQVKHLNNYVTLILNFVLTVVGAFVFGYYFTELQMGYKNTATQIMVGTCLATLVFIADLYFIIKQDATSL